MTCKSDHVVISGRFRRCVRPHNLFAAAIFISTLFYIKGLNKLMHGFMTPEGDIAFTAPGLAKSKPLAHHQEYIPASTEDFIMKHLTDLNLDLGRNRTTKGDLNNLKKNLARESSSGCNFWKNPALTTAETFKQLRAFRKELQDYYVLVDEFQEISDVRQLLDGDNSACQLLELHPKGLLGIFPSQQLSLTSSGHVEPLLPPMRHPDFCFQPEKNLMNLRYLVHDFAAMCRKLKRHSRIVLVDMGASLTFHHDAMSPTIYLTEVYRKFGMPFDHIYAYESTPTAPQKVFASCLSLD
jgi:hypothetical protein